MELGYDVVSTGGSASALAKAGLPVQKVEDVTGFPEMLDGMWAGRRHPHMRGQGLCTGSLLCPQTPERALPSA